MTNILGSPAQLPNYRYRGQVEKVRMPSINHDFAWDGRFRTVFPAQPEYCEECVNNLDYDTLPLGSPMRDTTIGPTSLKHLYKGANYYPVQKMRIPDDSLYGRDSSAFGVAGQRLNYGVKIYPYQHRSPREVREYTQNVKMPDIFE